MDTFDIEETKKEIILIVMESDGWDWDWDEMALLPGIKELRTFVCRLGPLCALNYAYFVDKGPHEETLRAVQVDFSCFDLYSKYVLSKWNFE